MKLTGLLLAIVVLGLLFGCATTRVAGECSETAGQSCMTRRVCNEDKSRGCVYCTCEAVWGSDPVREDERLRGKSP